MEKTVSKKSEDQIPSPPLPENIKLEENVLADALMSQDVLSHILGACEPDDFYHAQCRKVFSAMLSLYQERGSVDLYGLIERLTSDEEFKIAGGPQYIAALFARMVDSTQYQEHVLELKRLAEMRKISRIAYNAMSEVAMRKNPREIIANTTEALYSIAFQWDRSWRPASEAIVDSIEARKKALDEGRLLGLSTGFYKIDRITGGLRCAKYYVIAGRPSMGKSALAKNIAFNMVKNTGRPILFVSLEMSEEELAARDIAQIGDVNLTVWTTTEGLSHQKFTSVVTKMVSAVSHTEKIIQDTSVGLTPARLFSKIKQVLVRYPDLACVFIDYIQKMHPPKGQQRYDSENSSLTAISNKLQEFTKMFDLPFVVLSQLSRESGTDRPQLHNLRGSGSIEQDASVVMLLHRPGFYKHEAPQDMAEIIIAKNKEGPIGMVELRWNGEKSMFENMDTVHAEVPFPTWNGNGNGNVYEREYDLPF